MAEWGVSVYLGDPELPQRLPGYLKAVAARGGRHVFTSLHIPEVPLAEAVAQMEALTQAARDAGLAVVADIAPRVLAELGASPDNLEPLIAMGLSGVRLDYGFGPEAVGRFAANDLGLRILLNASTVDPIFLKAVMAAGADPSLLEGWHNYYPRPETGLAPAFVQRKSQLFWLHGLKVAAFVAGQTNRRGPLHMGLPTVERHRSMSPGRAAVELMAAGLIHTVVIGDPWAPEAELDQLSFVAGQNGVPLRVRLVADLPEALRRLVVEPVHTNRMDASGMVIRSSASRSYATPGTPVEPFHQAMRPFGSVTIDNSRYLRYAGELQITLQDLAEDPRVNVVGHVLPDDLPLLRQIGPGMAFRLVPVDDEGVARA